jgi:CRISPR system Cascade subunit CasA
MLVQKVFRIETADGLEPASLSESLARLCAGTLVAFEGLAAHQAHAWELFLFQLAALALVQSGEGTAAEDARSWQALADTDGWRQRLEALTPGCADTAWSVLVEDRTHPAFLQPPISAARWEGYTMAGRTPDEIDVLVTAKDHDVKAARAGAAEARHWIFALVALQTQQGYSGRGNFGIARMNGGFASRPMVMLTPARDLPARFRRGVQSALAARAAAVTTGDLYRPDGAMLLWLDAWDTEKSLPLAALDPLFIEICRRVRLTSDAAGHITAWGRSSEVPRVAVAKDLKGNLGDAFTPTAAKDGTALTVGAGGFDYRLVRRLLDPQEFTPPAAMEPRADDPQDGAWLRAAVLVRGQGKTEGLHERWLYVPTWARRAFGDRSPTLGKLSAAMMSDVDGAKKALARGLLVFLQGGTDPPDFKDERPGPWLDAFEHEVDQIFFDHLFARRNDNTDEILEQWRKALVGITRTLFERAVERLTPPQCRRERAQAMAEMRFWWLLKSGDLLPPPKPDAEEENA